MAIDERELNSAVENVMGYKKDLEGQRKLQTAGFEVKNTKMSDFVAVIDSNSRKAVAALGLTVADLERIETLGELLLNFHRGVTHGTMK